MAKVYVGFPTYKGDIHVDVLFASHQMTAGDHQVSFDRMDSSACCATFNHLLLKALDAHRRGEADYFLLWHSDVVPEQNFLDKMIRIAKEKGAEIVSAIIPIKDVNGLTSTALDEPVGDMPLYWRVRRLTMAEVMERPATWTDEKLLVNTGLLLVDLSKPWVNEIFFHFDDAIITHHGRRMPVVMPEDWMFSRDARKLGCKSMWVTREVAVNHFGITNFPNTKAWGVMRTDAFPPTPPDIKAAADAAEKVSGYMAWEELAYLATKAKDAKCIVELGSWKGRSTKAMAMASKGKVYAVDSWRGSGGGDETGTEAETRGRDTIKGEFYDNVAIPHKNVVVVDVQHEFAGSALKHVTGEVDYAFIDGDHAYEHVKRDILTCLDLMAPGGLLSGHDLDRPEVQKAVGELLPGWRHVVGSIWEFRVPVVSTTSTSAEPLTLKQS